jgi:hypothetical protein
VPKGIALRLSWFDAVERQDASRKTMSSQGGMASWQDFERSRGHVRENRFERRDSDEWDSEPLGQPGGKDTVEWLREVIPTGMEERSGSAHGSNRREVTVAALVL